MAARLGASRSAKRFKSCKVRVVSVFTSGKKTARSIALQAQPSVQNNDIQQISDEVLTLPTTTSSNPATSSFVHINEVTDVQEDPNALSDHHARRAREYARWETVREALLKGRIEEEAFSNDDHNHIPCCGCDSFAEIRCVDCGHEQYFCINCAKKTHDGRNHFHVLENFTNGCFVPLFPNQKAISLKHQNNCSTANSRNIVCIDQHGRQHKKQILFCDCEDDVVTLLKLQLWPGTVKRPVIAFHIKLMELAEALVMECQVSLRKFCDVLGIINKSSILPTWVKNFYSSLNSDSFDEFRYHQYMLRNGRPYLDEVQTGTWCPLCPQVGESGTVIESMDGCFGLVRKKSAGMNLCPSRHSLTMFADQDDVDNFVDNYTSNAKEAPADCHEFKAGEVTNMLRSKGRNKMYDEKGVFGRVCRHDFPKGFVNIKHGERIAYSVYEVERLLGNYGSTCINLDIKVMYDISCTLAAHLKKNERQDILDKVNLAIHIFHCYGHKSSCQIQFSPRRQKGYGLTDGEGIERLWSFLRGFSSMTKEMTVGRRTDLLTDALLHYSSRQLHSFGPMLLGKLKKCPVLISNTLTQLEELFSELPVPYDATVVKTWMKDEENLILAKGKKVVTLTWEQKYVQHLIHLHQLRSNVASIEEGDHSHLIDVVNKTKKVMKIVENIEKRQKVSKRWKAGGRQFNAAALCLENQRRETIIEQTYSLAVERVFLISLKRKYADGQAIATKLSKQINQRTNSIKAVVTKYNASLTVLQDCVDGLPEELQFDEAKDPVSPLYLHFSTQRPIDDIPYVTKRSAIDLHNFLERCKEEQELLLLEVERLFNYYFEKKGNLEMFLARHREEETKLMSGMNSIIKKQICEINNMLHSLGCTLFEYLKPHIFNKLPVIKITSYHMSNELETMEVEDNEMDLLEEDLTNDLVDLLEFDDDEEEGVDDDDEEDI